MKKIFYHIWFLLLPLSLAAQIQTQFYISPNSATDHPNPSPLVVRPIVAQWSDMLTAPNTDCNTYKTTSPLAAWISNFPSAQFMYTFSHIPKCANGTSNQANPPTDLGTTNALFAHHVDKVMQYLCGVSSPPVTPFSYTSCKNFKFFEGWNEGNVGLYWTTTGALMGKMETTAITELRKYCSDCVFIIGSTSAGGSGTGGQYTTFALSMMQNFDFSKCAGHCMASFHTYGSRTSTNNTNFVSNLLSNNDAACPGTSNSSCFKPVSEQVTYFRSAVLCDASITASACALDVVITEGGYGKNDQVCDVTDGDWTHTNVKFLRSAYISQWMLATSAQHPVFSLPYNDGDQAWMTFTGNGTGSTVAGVGMPPAICTRPNFTGATAVQKGFNATSAWLNSITMPGGSAISCTGSLGTEVCTLAVLKAGAAAEFKWYNGWLATTTVSTTYGTQQVFDSSTGAITTSSLSGSVTLSQKPTFLYNVAAGGSPSAPISVLALQ